MSLTNLRFVRTRRPHFRGSFLQTLQHLLPLEGRLHLVQTFLLFLRLLLQLLRVDELGHLFRIVRFRRLVIALELSFPAFLWIEYYTILTTCVENVNVSKIMVRKKNECMIKIQIQIMKQV